LLFDLVIVTVLVKLLQFDLVVVVVVVYYEITDARCPAGGSDEAGSAGGNAAAGSRGVDDVSSNRNTVDKNSSVCSRGVQHTARGPQSGPPGISVWPAETC